MEEQILAVSSDFVKNRSIKQTAAHFGLSTGTVRKMLVTSGVWSNRTVMDIAQVRRAHPEWDKARVAEELKISPKTVHLYSPYEDFWYLSESHSKTDTESAAVIDEGKCGDDVRWNLRKNGVLTISGTGPMMDYDGNSYQIWGGPRPGWWVRRDGYTVKKIVVEDGVTALGQYAFCTLLELEEVILPDTITEIKGGCFTGESHLRRFVVPPKVEIIAWDTFYSNVWLEEIVIPASVRRIQTFAFHACMSLRKVFFEGDAPKIAENAFDMCHMGQIGFYRWEGASGFDGEEWTGWKVIPWK